MNLRVSEVEFFQRTESSQGVHPFDLGVAEVKDMQVGQLALWFQIVNTDTIQFQFPKVDQSFQRREMPCLSSIQIEVGQRYQSGKW